MEASVDQLLSRRRSLLEASESRRPFALAVALHLLLVALVWGLPQLLQDDSPKPMRFVSVQVVPQAALGTPDPPPPPPPKPQPQPQPAAPPPPAPEPPAPEPPPPPPPDQPVLPPPVQTPPPPPPPPAPIRPEPAPTEPVAVTPTPQGSESGSRRGTATFGGAVATVDNPDFTYAYYIDRMTALIRSHWNRPAVPDGTAVTLRFRIAKNGTVSSLEVVESSGMAVFDRAAQRAVDDAAPLPPLPAGYRHDSLGITLIVR